MKKVTIYWKRSSIGEDPEPSHMFTDYAVEAVSVDGPFLTLTEPDGRTIHVSLDEIASWDEKEE